MDIPLLVIGLLLAATLSAFLGGLIPYPYGVLVLLALLIARLLHLKGRNLPGK